MAGRSYYDDPRQGGGRPRWDGPADDDRSTHYSSHHNGNNYGRREDPNNSWKREGPNNSWRGRIPSRQNRDFRGGYGRGRGDEEQRPEGGERERPPPGLKGREIGMWFARRSQAKKEKEQIQNRPTVSIDKDKERNIRHTLSNFRQEERRERGYGASSSHGANSQESGFKKPWNGNDESFSMFDQNDQKYARRASDQRDTRMKKEEPRESWEEMATESDSEHDQNDQPFVKEEPASSSSAFDATPVENQDDCDYDDNPRPSVTGVMEYMSSHGDYPYGMGVEADFESCSQREGNPQLDKEMKEKMQSLRKDPKFMEMNTFRQKLPASNMRSSIVATIDMNRVVVISGETGCGKTTQVPQFILDNYIEKGIGSQCSIICTQPRRISAISVAERVAAERCEPMSASGRSSVGYQIRLETKRPRTQGSILFCTTGIVLKFLEGDPKLARASHVIIDEIHERDLQSDFLLIILKDLILNRRDLKVILMSATLNAEMFSKYFYDCAMLTIPGYTFPVKEHCLEDVLLMTDYRGENSGPPRRQNRRGERKTQAEIQMEQDYQVWCRNQVREYPDHVVKMLQNYDYSSIDLDLILHLIKHIMTYLPDGAILVFLPGWEDIRKLNDLIQNGMRSQANTLKVIPLHSLMPTVNQREVFDRPPPGIRKIVIATNIAETSITIDDVVYVIDGGKIKVKGFQPEVNLTTLEPQWVSKANAKQRSGRAGRVQAGHCFHLYTKFHHDNAPDYLPPEMLRTRLEELCLQIKLLKLGRIVPFISKAMQHPSMEAIQHAVDTLTQLNALDNDENLLPLGYHLARMPVEPHTAKMILFGAMFGCLDHILTVAASLSFKDAFTIPLGREEAADKARTALSRGSKSDHIMLINAFAGWEESVWDRCSRNYCWDNFLSENTLGLLKDMKKQLAELLFDIGFIGTKNPKDPKANINKGNESMLRAILCAGLYPNVGQVTKVPKPNKNPRNTTTVGMRLKDGSKVFAHPKSVNKAESFFESKWTVFYGKLKTSKIYIHDFTMVSPFPLLFFGGKIDIKTENGQEVVTVDDWMIFKASFSTANLVKELRRQLDEVLTEKITNPGPTTLDPKTKEGAIMKAIADLITTEQIGSGRGDDGSIGVPPYRR